MKVRAKFQCTEKSESMAYGGGKNPATVKLRPVFSNDANSENKTFWEYTPSGAIELQVVKGDAAELFEVGKEYYVDFTLAE